MLHPISSLKGYRLDSLDGEIGSVRDVYFDCHEWTVRYLIVNTGSWLLGKEVLISPHALGRIEVAEESQLGVRQTIKKHGAPQGVTPEAMIWTDVAPDESTKVTKRQDHHDFPMPPMDYMEHTISCIVPAEKPPNSRLGRLRELHRARKEGRLVTDPDRLYTLVRHPQYTGLFIALFGEVIVHWPTIFSVALFPVIVIAWDLLERSEEGKVEAGNLCPCLFHAGGVVSAFSTSYRLLGDRPTCAEACMPRVCA